MNPREQEIWKRCYSGLKMEEYPYSVEHRLIVEFKGHFVCDSPVYHYTYFSIEYNHNRDIDGWEDPVYHLPGEERDNDPRFPRPPATLGRWWINTSMIIQKFFHQLEQGLGSLKPTEPPPPRVLSLLRESLPIPDELILLTCTNLFICELEWLGRLLTLEELEKE